MPRALTKKKLSARRSPEERIRKSQALKGSEGRAGIEV